MFIVPFEGVAKLVWIAIAYNLYYSVAYPIYNTANSTLIPVSTRDSKAYRGTLAAHADGGVPVITMEAGKLNADKLGELFWFFELSCAISAYILGVNPFNQPGVEDYKRNMFTLLGKPGYEQ